MHHTVQYGGLHSLLTGSTVDDYNILNGFVSISNLDSLDSIHDFVIGVSQALAKHNMFAVQVSRRAGADKELGSVGVTSSVGHAQKAQFIVLPGEVLICKFLAVDALSPSAVVSGEVSALDHEIFDHSVELGTLVSVSILSGTQLTEVPAGFGSGVIIQLEGHPLYWVVAVLDIKETVGHFEDVVGYFLT